LLDGINSIFFHLILFLFLAAGFCPKNLAFARIMTALPDSAWACSHPAYLARTLMDNVVKRKGV